MKRWLRVASLLALVATTAEARRDRDPVDLVNVFLGPDYANWMVGALGEMANDREVDEFLSLKSDDEAAVWIDGFWATRDPDPKRPGNPLRTLVEERSREADRRYSEGGVLGRRTDRGVIYVLYGEPESTRNEPSPIYGDPALEIWEYPRRGERGLDGDRPLRAYRFARRGDLTQFYIPGRPQSYSERHPGGRR